MGTSIREGIMLIRHGRPRGLAACGCLLLAFLGAGCGREQTRKQVTIVAGVEVIANPAVPLHKDPGRVLKVREKLRIRDTGDQFYFRGPDTPEIAADGSIFIHQIGQLLKFSPEGAYFGDLIKPGQGPGEVEMPLGYLVEGDGIFVIDGGRYKVVHMTLDGRLIDETKLDEEAQVLTRGWFVGLQSRLPQERGKLADMTHIFVCVSRPDGQVRKSYTFLGKHYWGKSHFTWDTPYWAADAGRDLLFISISRDYAVKVLDLDAGRVVRSFSRAYPKVPYVVHPQAKAIFADGAPKPDFEEDIHELFHAGDSLWVRTSTVDPQKGQLFDVFSAEGDFLDSFYVQIKGRIIGVRGDTIFVNEEAEGGTISIVLYRNVERAGLPSPEKRPSSKGARAAGS
jgi:hypothetical protein